MILITWLAHTHTLCNLCILQNVWFYFTKLMLCAVINISRVYRWFREFVLICVWEFIVIMLVSLRWEELWKRNARRPALNEVFLHVLQKVSTLHKIFVLHTFPHAFISEFHKSAEIKWLFEISKIIMSWLHCCLVRANLWMKISWIRTILWTF